MSLFQCELSCEVTEFEFLGNSGQTRVLQCSVCVYVAVSDLEQTARQWGLPGALAL